MSVSRNMKLGVFALGAITAAIALALALGIRAMKPATIGYHTYFDESVQGLELGSPVKYRGVQIGSVEGIAVAPDRKHVDVTLALVARDAARLGLGNGSPDLRAQLGVQGITGLRFVEIDFFDAARNPPAELPFEPDEHYLPAQPSLIKGLGADLEAVAERMPAVLDHLGDTLSHVDRLLDEVGREQLVARIGAAVDQTGAAASELRRLTSHVDHADLPQRTRDVLARAHEVLGRLDGDNGLVASAHRATESLGDVGRSTAGTSDDLARTLRELGDAARAVRELAEEIERDPDMLVKGRARSQHR